MKFGHLLSRVELHPYSYRYPIDKQPDLCMLSRSFKTSITVLVAALGAGLMSAAPALALDDGQEGLFDSILGAVGVGGKKSADIEYRDRAPLVLPPKMALRQPLPAGAQRPASWPVDPDVVRRAREAEEGKAVLAPNSDRFRGRPLTKEELLAGRGVAPTGGPEGPTNCAGTRGRDCIWVRPDVLRAQGIKKEEQAGFVVGEEPERKYLVEPPKGYRKVTKQVKVTQSAPIQKEDTSPLSFFKKINPWDKEED